ncbi:MAG: hypothetical protein Q9213_002420 [Squamulea squamosa]
MIQDDERPMNLPRDLSEWSMYSTKQDMQQGIKGIVEPVLDRLGYANLRPEDAAVATGVQDIAFKSDGQTHPGTRGSYRSEFLLREDMHIMIATYMRSPRWVVGKDKPMPALSRWSDWT